MIESESTIPSVNLCNTPFDQNKGIDNFPYITKYTQVTIEKRKGNNLTDMPIKCVSHRNTKLILLTEIAPCKCIREL